MTDADDKLTRRSHPFAAMQERKERLRAALAKQGCRLYYYRAGRLWEIWRKGEPVGRHLTTSGNRLFAGTWAECCNFALQAESEGENNAK